jgi:hypothetical protein
VHAAVHRDCESLADPATVDAQGSVRVASRFIILFMVAILLALHAYIVSHKLESAFLIVSFCWAWVAVAALFGRLEPVKSMAATMVVLLLLSAVFLMATPFGRGDTKGFYALAWFPSIIAFGCVYIYAVYLQRSDATPNVSLDAEYTVLPMPSRPRDVVALRMDAEEFARRMSEGAVGREQRGDDGDIFVDDDARQADVAVPVFTVPKVA